MVSDGVTAKMASVIPAPRPAELKEVRFSERNKGPKPTNKAPRCTDFALRITLYQIDRRKKGTYISISQLLLEKVIADKPHTCLDRVAYDEGCTSRVQPCETLVFDGVS